MIDRDLFKSYHEREPGWGSLHIVMSDGNLEDDNVAFCLRWAIREDDKDGEEIARQLLELTYEERLELYNENL